MNTKMLIAGITMFCSVNSVAQESIHATGGESTGISGSASFSIGQVVFSSENGISGNLNQGVQQPYEIFIVGLEEGSDNIQLSLFPNPASSYLQLEIADFGSSVYALELTDESGRMIIRQVITTASTRIPVAEYAEAIYFLSITLDGKKSKTYKIIKN